MNWEKEGLRGKAYGAYTRKGLTDVGVLAVLPYPLLRVRFHRA